MNPDTPARLPLDDVTVPAGHGPLPTHPIRWLPGLGHAATSNASPVTASTIADMMTSATGGVTAFP